jgi:DNA-binding NarL/FixJ family response regulator
LVRNLAEALQKTLAPCRAEIRQADSDQSEPDKPAEKPIGSLPPPATWQQRTPAHVEQAHQARQASRDDRFRQMTALRAQGLTQAAIAKRMAMSEKAVRTCANGKRTWPLSEEILAAFCSILRDLEHSW